MTATPTVPAVPSKNRTDSELDQQLDRVIKNAREIRDSASIVDDRLSEAEQSYRGDVVVTLAMMEYDLLLSRAALNAHNARGADELHLTVTALADAARSWADDMEVQTHLAALDVRDRWDSVGQRLERAAAEARRASTRLGESLQGDVGEVRRIALEGIRSVRATLSDALDAARGE